MRTETENSHVHEILFCYNIYEPIALCGRPNGRKDELKIEPFLMGFASNTITRVVLLTVEELWVDRNKLLLQLQSRH